MKKKRQKIATASSTIKFVEQICRLNEFEIVGVAKLMGVELFEDEEKKTPRNFESVLSDMIDNYITCTKDKRKKINFILKTAQKEATEKLAEKE